MRWSLAAAAAALALAALAAGPSLAATEGDWPCIQRRVDEISAGQIWAGPELPAPEAWRDDDAITNLLPTLVSRRVPVEDAAKAIDSFSKATEGPDHARKLTALFAATLERINTERTRIMNGIVRYARKQRDLSERIGQTGKTIEEKRKAGADAASLADLEQQLKWDTRVYDDRSQALTYVCESPTLLEQRAFDIARAIQSHLE